MQGIKIFIQQAHSRRLDSDENADRWFGNLQPYSANERRILISHWAGEASEKLISDRQRTGCLITADGSEDHLINPESVPKYEVTKVISIFFPGSRKSQVRLIYHQ